LRMWPKFERFAEEEVQARQELNAEHAVSLALRDGITWLLHCDADELFHCPDRSVVEHFNRLTADRVTVRPKQRMERKLRIERFGFGHGATENGP
jgi:hypothetical protein